MYLIPSSINYIFLQSTLICVDESDSPIIHTMHSQCLYRSAPPNTVSNPKASRWFRMTSTNFQQIPASLLAIQSSPTLTPHITLHHILSSQMCLKSLIHNFPRNASYIGLFMIFLMPESTLMFRGCRLVLQRVPGRVAKSMQDVAYMSVSFVVAALHFVGTSSAGQSTHALAVNDVRATETDSCAVGPLSTWIVIL